MRHFINLKDISAKDLRKILIDAKKRKNFRKKLDNLQPDKGSPLKGKLLIQMFEKSSLRTRLSFYLAIKQLGGSTLTLRPNELHYLKGNSKKALKNLKWKPKISLRGLIKEMIDYDIQNQNY